MQEEKSRTVDITPTKEDAEHDATSKETVSDLEKSGGSSDTEKSNDSGNGGNSNTPSPDGQFDSARGSGAGPGDDTGPM